MHVDFICLANSWKHGGRCVAGIKADGSGWVRVLGQASDGTLFPGDYSFADHSEAGIFDLIRVGVAEPRSSAYQPENWLIDGSRWQLLSRPAPPSLAPLLKNAVCPEPELLGGVWDRLAKDDLERNPAEASLALVAPPSFELFHQLSYAGRARARGKFTLSACGRSSVFNLSITDPMWHPAIVTQASPRIIDNAAGCFLLTISLGEEFGGFHYKLIATIAHVPEAYGPMR